MVIAAAKNSIDHHQSLGVVANIQLVCEPHATVQLYCLAENQFAGSIDYHRQGVDRGGNIPL